MMETVIFVGIQATGKSTYYCQNFFKTHVRINLDMLRTRHREAILLQACLTAKQPFVVDNTNPTVADRARYITLAKHHHFMIHGYYFQSELEEAIKRNNQRQGVENIPLPGILNTYKRLQIPTYSEGFDKLFYVSITSDGNFAVQEWQNEV